MMGLFLRTRLRGVVALALAASGSVDAWAQSAPPVSAIPVIAGSDIQTPVEPPAIALRKPVARPLPEQWEMGSGTHRNVRNVVNPTLTPFLPNPVKASGAAVIVVPGGAFRFVSMDNEGYLVAQWLADRGIAAFVLKYRTVPVPRDRAGYAAATAAFMRSLPPSGGSPLLATPEAVEDAQAAVRLVRARAAEWQIDPGKVGMIGFSAGAITALDVGLAADRASRPDFIAPIYPPMMARQVSSDAPPMFLAVALDDALFAVGKPLGLIQSWRDAKRPLEVHLYEKGGHGFGTTRRSQGSAQWQNQFTAWLKDRKIIRWLRRTDLRSCATDQSNANSAGDGTPE